MPSNNRVGTLAVAMLLLGAIGCNQGTQIPLADVPPVKITPREPPKGFPKGAIVSPDR